MESGLFQNCGHKDAPVVQDQPDSKCCSGFTLIEIATVLAIIGMVLLLVIPRFPSTDSENLKISARTLAGTLRYLQDRASTGKTGYSINLAPGTGTFTLLETTADGSGREPSDPLLQKSPLKEGILITDVVIPRLGKISDGQLRLDLGRAGLRDFTTIHLRSADGTFRTVMAFPGGGKVKVYEGYQEESQ